MLAAAADYTAPVHLLVWRRDLSILLDGLPLPL
jgi:hypothetical protein